MQTIYVAAPGFQSVDIWLPIAVEQKNNSEDEIILVFPYYWVLELIPETDSLLRIISDNNFRIAVKFFPFDTFIVFRNMFDAMSYIRFIKNFKIIFKMRSPVSRSIYKRFHAIRKCFHGIGSLQSVKRLRCNSNGVMIWDLLNLNPEPARKLKKLIKATKDWRRIAFNVGAVYAEFPLLGSPKASHLDSVVSFSESQSIIMTEQYGLSPNRISLSTVPKFSDTWIDCLETYSKIDYQSIGPYALLVSRKADPPLLYDEDRLNLLACAINQICGIRNMKLLIKLHPNENQDTFVFDLDTLQKRKMINANLRSRILLVTDHVLVIARHATYGLAYFSNTVADMVRVKCPAIQILPVFPKDGKKVVKEKRSLDFGFVEIASSMVSLSVILNQIDVERELTLARQQIAWSEYFSAENTFMMSEISA